MLCSIQQHSGDALIKSEKEHLHYNTLWETMSSYYQDMLGDILNIYYSLVTLKKTKTKPNNELIPETGILCVAKP